MPVVCAQPTRSTLRAVRRLAAGPAVYLPGAHADLAAYVAADGQTFGPRTLRFLAAKGLARRPPGTFCFILTAAGRRLAASLPA